MRHPGLAAALIAAAAWLADWPRDGVGAWSQPRGGTAARAILAKARQARNMDALGRLRARPLSIEYDYVASWAPDKPGSLTLEFGRPGTYARREHTPWQRFITSTTRLDAASFERSFSDGTTTTTTGTEAAEANLRATALADWLGVLHEPPGWARVTYVPPSAEQIAAGGVGTDVVRMQGANLDVRMYFDRATRRLVNMTQSGTMTGGRRRAGGAPQPPVRPAMIETAYGKYQRFNGVDFATETTVSFTGGPPEARGMSFTARVKRITF